MEACSDMSEEDRAELRAYLERGRLEAARASRISAARDAVERAAKEWRTARNDACNVEVEPKGAPTAVYRERLNRLSNAESALSAAVAALEEAEHGE